MAELSLILPEDFVLGKEDVHNNDDDEADGWVHDVLLAAVLLPADGFLVTGFFFFCTRGIPSTERRLLLILILFLL